MRLIAPFVLIIAVLSVVFWLDDTPADADLVFVNQNEVFTLDPQRMSYMQDLRLAHALYEGLVRWDISDYAILPAVAAELPTISPDGLTYTFPLRPDARWANGEPVTAHDFIYAWRRALLPDTAADYTNLFFVIDGGEDFFSWRIDQTRAFAANPFDDPEKATDDAIRLCIQRLGALLIADDLPQAIATPDDRIAIAGELARLRSALDTSLDSARTELASVNTCRTWMDQLDAPDSRAAEALWMWRSAEQRFASTVGLTAPDDHTLIVRLHQPTTYFLDLLCFSVFFPVHRPTVEGWPENTIEPSESWASVTPPDPADCRWIKLNTSAGKLEQKHSWARPEHHVGNGPYRLAQWRYKRDMRLERNANFRDPTRATCDSILALTIEDTNTSVLAFESGRVDWLVDVSADYKADMIAQRRAYIDHHADALVDLAARGITGDVALAQLPPPEDGERRDIHVFPTFGTDFYNFNCRPTLADGRPNPFAHAAVRRAFALSVDKHSIVDRATRLHEPVVHTLIPPDSIPGYNSPTGLALDPVRARAELASAGWEDRNDDGLIENEAGDPFPVIDLLYTTNTPRYKWISLNLKDQWERELGVHIELRSCETKFYKEDLKQGKFMIARGNWYGDYGDPTTFLDLCRSTDGNNDRKFNSAKVDAMLDAAAAELDPEKRMRMLEECERHLFEVEVPLLPICQLVNVYMYRPGEMTGLSQHPRMTQYLWRMEVTRP